MMKLAVLILLVGAASASGFATLPVVPQIVSPVISPVVSSQRAIIPQLSSYGYGTGVSSRYFDKVDYGYGSGIYGLGFGGLRTVAPKFVGAISNPIGGINNLGLANNNYGYGSGIYGLGFGGLRTVAPKFVGAINNPIGGINPLGLANNNYGLYDGRVLGLGYGLGGQRYRLGGVKIA